jgi:hypothetical protein
LQHADWLILSFIAAFTAWILGGVARARRGAVPFIRRIPGLSAIEEALGRATEMGRPILFSPSTTDEKQIETYAALKLLAHVARVAARYGTRLIVAVCKPAVYPMAEEVCREAYREVGAALGGRPLEEDVRFLSPDHAVYSMTVAATIEREQCACAFFFGSFDWTSLLMTEPGHRAGAIQIAGDSQIPQIPFFIASCDYTLIGEELFAASAYVSDDATLKGSLAAQDRCKLLLLAIVLLGIVLMTVPAWQDCWFVELFRRFQ